MAQSFILGLLCTALFFIISLTIVLGIKWLYYTLKKLFDNKTQNTTVEKDDSTSQPAKKRKKKTTQIIEIDPDIADRIYFKKSS